MPKLKLSGRKLCTSGRKLAVCGCGGDPCCTTIVGSTTYIPATAGLRQLFADTSIGVVQTTTGWSDDAGQNPVLPPFSATGQMTVTASTDSISAGPSCSVGGVTFPNIYFDSNAQAWTAGTSYGGTYSFTVSTPAPQIVISNGQLSGFLQVNCVPSPETPANTSGSLNTVGASLVANTGFQSTKTVLEWAGFAYLYSNTRGNGTQFTTFSAFWTIVVKISSNGKYVVYARGRPSFRTVNPTTAQSITVTPILASANPIGFTLNGSFTAISPASGTVPQQTDTLDMQATVQSNLKACGTGIATLAALDDALFS